jgi:putative ABC transport system permease protein
MFWPSFLLAWRQLSFHRMKLAVASAGVVVAVMLMLVQLGIREGAMDGSVSFVRKISADLCLISPRTKTIFQSTALPRRLLYRLLADPDVERVQELYLGQARWRNPWTYQEWPISVYGLDPEHCLVDLEGYAGYSTLLHQRDRAVFDQLSRDTYGPVVETIARDGFMETEVNRRLVRVVGSIRGGVSITTDGNLYLTPENFLRVLPERNPGGIDVGLIKLKPGADPRIVRDRLAPLLDGEAIIMSRQELVDAEVRFVREVTPIDFIFGMGAVVGFFIGFVVVYQILYTEVTNHLPQFATLKAMGFTNRYLLQVVISQAFMLSILGYFPGFLLAIWLYGVAERAIQMEFSMTVARAFLVFGFTLLMCGLSGAIAVRKAQSADPADVF